MLLFTTRMLPLPLDPFFLYLHLDFDLELEGMLLDKVVLVKDLVKYQSRGA